MALKDIRWALVETMPAEVIEMSPNWLVRLMPSAQAPIGKANASTAKPITRLMF
jgi:hypothetical protein